MYDIQLDIEAVLVWYYLLVAGILIITFLASWKHSTPMPFAWGLLMGVLILWLRDYIAPMIFGVLNYSWTETPLLFTVTGLFSVAWFGYIGLTLYNMWTEGEVVL